MNFQGKVAVITGGASGMGAAAVKLFSAAGGRATLVDMNGELAQQVAAETGAIPMIGDVSDSDFCNQAIADTVNRFGQLDMLINAAGINLREPWEDITEASWEQTLDINLSTPFFLARHCIDGTARPVARW